MTKPPSKPQEPSKPCCGGRCHPRQENPPEGQPGPLDAVCVVIPGKPVSTNQTYRTGKAGHWFKSEASVAWQNLVTLCASRAMQDAKREPFACPVEVAITFYFADERPDLDGPIKGLLDRLQPRVYRNDRQVRRLVVDRKVDKTSPRTEVHVRPWQEVELVHSAADWAAIWEARG